MSFFPLGFDPRADAMQVVTLANVNTPDGDFGFLLGQDGKFTDVDGKVWWGSVLLSQPDVPVPIDGLAPAGEVSMTYFQDPALPDLVDQVLALGSDYIRGRPLTFYVQVFSSAGELSAPVLAPIPLARFEMRSIAVEANGPLQRRIALSYEGVFAGRNEARLWFYSTADHALLVGAANPSLEFMPKEYQPEEKLF